MKKQVWYQTSLGYNATRSKLEQLQKIVGDGDASKGRLTFYLKDFMDATFQITTKGKLGIYYPEEVGYESLLEQVKPLLVKADGTPAEIIKESKRKIPFRQKKVLDVKRAIEDLRFRLLREPTILEIAYQVGETPEIIREAAFKLSPKIDWKEPTKDQVEEAEKIMVEVYESAALLTYFGENVVLKRPTYHLYKVPSSLRLSRAKYAQKNEIDKLPKIFSVPKDQRLIKNEKYLELVYRWPNRNYSGWNYELYDKEEKTLSGHFGHAKKILKEVWDSTLPQIKELIK